MQGHPLEPQSQRQTCGHQAFGSLVLGFENSGSLIEIYDILPIDFQSVIVFLWFLGHGFECLAVERRVLAVVVESFSSS